MMSATDLALTDAHEFRDPKSAEKYLAAARQAESKGERLQAVESYEAAYVADPDNPETCFRLAYHLDLMGEENEALHLYEQCAQQDRPQINVLLNLGVMYEDRCQYAKAERCVRQVLATDPNHPRARLFLKDILASKAMVVDAAVETRLDKSGALLDTPVTDFDLSVRARNCLRKMNVRTLGDLLRVTEAELRSYKNFGDTSLDEIKAMLAQRGLRMGQSTEQQHTAVKEAVYNQLQDTAQTNNEIFHKPVNELALSVRARKALVLLNVQTIGDLCMKTEAELMGVKNFGITSLQEIKEKLTPLGIGLRSLE
jgi:DNA-directed RNA polymerase subunit alpha